MIVDLYHDTVCPWCRIGKAHLEEALANWEGEPVTVRYRTFFLNPDIPREGYPFREYMLAKGGRRISLEEFFARPREMGAAAGLTFNFEAIERAPNSTLSHHLIALAPDNKKAPVVEAVYKAYFEEGQDIGQQVVLEGIAAEQGLDVDAVRSALKKDAWLDHVLADARWAREAGITGVPFFIVNQRYAFSGAQPPHLIRQVLLQAQAEQADGRSSMAPE